MNNFANINTDGTLSGSCFTGSYWTSTNNDNKVLAFNPFPSSFYINTVRIKVVDLMSVAYGATLIYQVQCETVYVNTTIINKTI